MVSGQFFLGLPLPLFCPGVQFNTCLAVLFMFILAMHMTQPRQSFPSDDAAKILLSCSFPDYLVWYFIPPCDIQYPPQPSVMRRLQSPAICYCDWPCLGSVAYSNVLNAMDSYSRTLVSTLQPLLFYIFP